MNNYEKYQKAGQNAISQAAKFLGESFGDFKEMRLKSGTHYGIEDDLQSNRIIENYLRKETPEVGIYSEEGERNLESELVWVIDPIDGTTNYSVGIPLFVTQLCLLERGDPVLSFLNSPILQMDFSSQVNQGAKMNGKEIRVSDLEDLSKAVVNVNKGNDNRNFSEIAAKLGKKVRTIRCFGSTGIDLAFVASGKIDLLIDYGSDLYDYAPGVLLVRESGGVAVTAEGKDWSYKDSTLIAGNRNLVEQILKLL